MLLLQQIFKDSYRLIDRFMELKNESHERNQEIYF